MDPYSDNPIPFTPAKRAKPGFVWMPKHPIDFRAIPLARLASVGEREHAACNGQPCDCVEFRWPCSQWQRFLDWLSR